MQGCILSPWETRIRQHTTQWSTEHNFKMLCISRKNVMNIKRSWQAKLQLKRIHFGIVVQQWYQIVMVIALEIQMPVHVWPNWWRHQARDRTCNDRVILDGSAHNHDSIVQRSFCFFDELFSTATHDDGASFRFGALLKEVKPTIHPIRMLQLPTLPSTTTYMLPCIRIGGGECTSVWFKY